MLARAALQVLRTGPTAATVEGSLVLGAWGALSWGCTTGACVGQEGSCRRRVRIAGLKEAEVDQVLE